MEERRISYGGVGAAVAGVIGIIGIYSTWWETPTRSYNGTDDISGRLALAMSVGLFAFGVAYVLLSDPQVRRAMGSLATLCAVILTLACVWGVIRAGNVAPGAEVGPGLVVSVLGGVLGIAAGFLVLRDGADSEKASTDVRDDGMSV